MHRLSGHMRAVTMRHDTSRYNHLCHGSAPRACRSEKDQVSMSCFSLRWNAAFDVHFILFFSTLYSCDSNNFYQYYIIFKIDSHSETVGMKKKIKTESNKAANQFLCCSYMYLFVL